MEHKKKVARISAILRARKSKKPVDFIKKAVSHQVPKPGQENLDKIDISDLNDIIEIDKKNRTCTAEPGVTFSDLVKETMKHRLVPYLVPELKTITIGGAVVGCSVEAMSYKYGGFHDSCLEYEYITAKGDIKTCSPSKDPLFFNMIHGTFGTLCILTRLKFKLLPAKRFVHMKHEKYSTLKAYKKAIWQHYKKRDVDFMDGIIHAPDMLVLCIGQFTDKAPYTHKYEWMRVFYKSTLKRDEDYLTTYDYFFRYDSDCHWIARNYGLENPVLRLLFGKFFLSSTKMLKLARKTMFLLKKKKPDVVVDVFVPFCKLDDFIKFYNAKMADFPVWVVPYRVERLYPWLNPEHFKGAEDQLFIDLAIYGMKQRGETDHYRLVEEELLSLPGLKTLISHNSYTQEEFWRVWNKENYSTLKKKTDPDNIFRDIYHKTHPGRK